MPVALIIQVHLCLKILINCASVSSNLPAFNSTLSQSDVIVSVLPLTHGQHSNLALCSKILLALINPLLDCEQLRALKLTSDEADMCVSLLNKAVVDSHHLSQECSLLTFLRATIWFVHEYSRKDKTLNTETCSDYEKKMDTVSHELESNAHLLVEKGLLSILKAVFQLNGKEELQAAAARLTWCLAHNDLIRTQILKNKDIVGALQSGQTHLSPKLSMASFCALWLLGVEANGMKLCWL